MSVGSSGTGNFQQTGGTNQLNGNSLFVGENSFGNGTYSLGGGTLTTPAEYVGHFGIGAFIQSAGTNTIAANGTLIIGNGDSVRGSYTLSGTAATTLTINGSEYIGEHATGNATQSGGTFTQSGGTHTIAAGTSRILSLGTDGGSTGTYNLSGGTLNVNVDEYIGHNSAGTFGRSGGTFNQTGGTHNIINAGDKAIYIGNTAGSTGAYNLSGTGLLTVAGKEYIGFTGAGVFTQTGGEHDVGDVNNLEHLYLGRNATSSGSYSLGNGTLTVSGTEFIGDGGAGSFNQTGGRNQLGSGSVVLGNSADVVGNYTLSGGQLFVNSSVEFVGYSGTGIFTQSGGQNELSGFDATAGLNVGFNATGVGTYSLSGGTLTSRNITVGVNGTGTFDHTAGQVQLSGAVGNLIVGQNLGSHGTYNLSGAGSIMVANPGSIGGQIFVGKVGTGTFNQTGGTITANTLIVGNSDPNTDDVGHGTYTLSGGVANFIGPDEISQGVVISTNLGSGTLSVSGSGVLNTTSINVYFHGDPTTGLKLDGGTINTGHLFLLAGADTGSFTWTTGTLHFTNSVTWDPDGATDTSNTFGTGRTLVNNQTLLISGTETLGRDEPTLDPFGLTLNTGSVHSVMPTSSSIRREHSPATRAAR